MSRLRSLLGGTAPPDPLSLLADLLDPPPVPDPVTWAKERLGTDNWSKQAEVKRAVAEHQNVAVKSCHASGKSWGAAEIVAWWLDSHPPGEALVITTAPRWVQVRAILWRYIGQLAARADPPLRGYVNQTEWHMPGAGLVAMGRKPADYDETGFQGFHARYILVVLDEACGIGETLWTAISTVLTSAGAKVLAIGNPDIPGTPFARCFQPDSGWHCITIRAWDTPAFTGEPVTQVLSDNLLTKEWVEARRKEWVYKDADGKEHHDPRWVSKVLAEFPDDDPQSMVRLSWLGACKAVPPSTGADLLPHDLGVDVGGGGDATVVRERMGRAAGREWQAKTEEPSEIADLVVTALRETGATRVKIDSIGIGWGVVTLVKKAVRADAALRAQVTGGIHGINVSKAPRDKTRFHILKDELWWEMRVMAQTTWLDLSAMENAEETLSQMAAPRYSTPSGKVKVEPKDVTKERIGRSPDNADAMILAYAEPITKSGKIRGY